MTDDALIRAEHLDVGYGDVGIIQDLTFAVRRGAVSALMGRNGVGKTTLVKTLIGLLKPSRGELYYKDENITRLPPYVRSRNGIGYVPQGRQIFPRLTVAENLKTGVRTARRGIPQAVYEHFPVLWEMRDRLGGDLSGGQQQQLAIGRAIVTDPELLILDEPTEGIQPNIIQRIGEVLRFLAEVSGVTILIVEQYLDFIREYSSDFKILNRGAIVASGQTDELTAEHVAQFLHL